MSSRILQDKVAIVTGAGRGIGRAIALGTDAFENWRAARPEFVDNLVKQIPMRRLGEPGRDGGPLAVFLASPGSDYITGSTFMLEGGLHLMPCSALRTLEGTR